MRIESLTEAQKARFPEFIERWTRIGLDTTPAARPRAEAAILRMYEIAGKKPPRIVWCGSPLAQGLTRALLLDRKFMESLLMKPVDPGDSVGASVRDSVWDSVRDSVWASVWDSVGDSVRASVRASVWDSVRASVWDSVRASVWDSVRASVWDSVGDSVGASVRASVWASVRASVGASVRASVWASVWASVGASVGDSVGASVRDSVRASVRDSVGASVGASVWDSVGDSVGASVRDSVRASVGASCYGQHDANWLAFFDFFREVCGLTDQTSKLEGLWELAKAGGWVLPHENICWASERPSVLNLDDQGQLHCENGPAVAYPDGWMIFAIHGVRPIPEYVVMEPEKITIEKIDAEGNGEIRRIMIERMGHAKYLDETGAVEVHADEIPIGGGVKGFIARALLKDKHGAQFLCGHDGSTERIYFMSVDPRAKTCADAHESISGFKDKLIIANA